MKKRIFTLLVALGAICGSTMTASAQTVEVTGGFDIVNQSVWRGCFLDGNVQVQPALTASVAGLSLTAWGSTPLDYSEISSGKELDFTLAYDFELSNGGALGLAVTDYWWDGEDSAYFDSTLHQWEATISYTISEDVPLCFSWNTMFAGELDKDDDGQMYSTYIEVSYPFSAGPVDCSAAVGMTPWTSAYSYGTSTGFSVASVSFGVSYDLLSFTDKFALPIFVDLIAVPTAKDAFLIAGLSFAM
ncbi:MAG: hypothetical protein SNJ33_07845 [Rikenellaceae bacterium]